jgi:hypothetical protein
MRALRWLRRLLLLGLALFLAFLAWGYARNHPEDVPWTPLDLGRPLGAFTRAKLAATQGAECRALLRRAGIAFVPLPPRRDGPECGWSDAVRLEPAGAATIAWRPPDLATSCRVAAARALWEWHVVQPAALARFGSRVRQIETYGSYSCRRVYGRSSGQWSEHAHANAVDVAAFRLEDGRGISVAADWRDAGPKGRFLRDVRDGACGLFSTTLSPEYNAAHHDHLHLDEAGRSGFGWHACR